MPFLFAGPVIGSSTPIRIVSWAWTGPCKSPLRIVARTEENAKNRIISILLGERAAEKSYRKLRHAAIALVLCVQCKTRMPQPVEFAPRALEGKRRRGLRAPVRAIRFP